MSEIVINHKSVEIRNYLDHGQPRWFISAYEVLCLTGDDKQRVFNSIKEARQWIDLMLETL